VKQHRTEWRIIVAGIPFRLRFSRKAKRMWLQVVPGEVQVTAPAGTSMSIIEKFVHSREKWIREKLSGFASVEPLPVPTEYSNGSVVCVLGETPVLRLSESGLRAGEIVLRDGVLLACLAPGADLSRAVKKWLDNRLLSFSEAIVENCSMFEFKPTRIRLGNARTRWGSCSSHGVIMINRKLIHAPRRVVEYVLIHELVHLKHRNHSRLFWDSVTQLLGDVKPERNWLRLQGSYLL
jgi:predicted metal-dependent hydrolase